METTPQARVVGWLAIGLAVVIAVGAIAALMSALAELTLADLAGAAAEA